jgi:hypothetical protein
MGMVLVGLGADPVYVFMRGICVSLKDVFSS